MGLLDGGERVLEAVACTPVGDCQGCGEADESVRDPSLAVDTLGAIEAAPCSALP
jgi:hypothetical protein